MYNELVDELVKDLRENHDKYFARDMQAADAIEELSKDLERSKEWETFWEKEANEALKKFQTTVAKIPKWIPVTERLPKSNGVYLVNNGDRVWTCNFVLLGEVRGWANSARNPVVRAWMPLPEPPKEE